MTALDVGKSKGIIAPHHSISSLLVDGYLGKKAGQHDGQPWPGMYAVAPHPHGRQAAVKRTLRSYSETGSKQDRDCNPTDDKVTVKVAVG